MEIYVKEMPKSCVNCKYFAEHRRQCNLELCLQWNEAKFKFDDCPLIDIKTHDRELIKEVCEKIRNFLLDKCEFDYGYYINDGDFTVPDLWYFLDQIQKEFEDE